jgi:2-dehydro-3-deoxyphosphooctonate aldolase (KDO 8-P synthase)
MTTDEQSFWDTAFGRFGPLERPVNIGPVRLGDGSLALIAGPCAIESEKICLLVAEKLSGICADLKIPYIFKSSFDKANRTSASSFRGTGLDQGLAVLTDVHETDQVQPVADVVDVLQIPAFLCRQTDLLVECGRLGQAVNIKKGQFLAAEDMRFAVEKVTQSGTQNVLVTERGALFGYRDLVVDMRNLVIMRTLGYPVVFDATHSVQQMGAAGGSSGGLPAFIPAHVRAAAAVGIDALFIETHPDPAQALSDGSNMVPLDRIRTLLEMALEVHSTHRVKAS